MSTPPDTFPALLDALLRAEPGRPLVTFYDQRDGSTGGDGHEERVELSVTTHANWVAKAASLLADELDLERGARLRLDLPTHWLGPVFLGAAWTLGLVVTDDADPDPDPQLDAVVCGPATLDAWADLADEVTVLACSLLPLGVRFPDGVPAGVHDVGVEIWSQPDAFTPWDPPSPEDPALATASATLTQREVLAPAGSDRLLTTTNPASSDGAALVAGLLAGGGSAVLLARPDPARLEATYAAERATSRRL